MWGKPAAYVVIRPSRYTKEFVDSNDRLSISVLDDSYRDILKYFGTVSGRDEDKIEKSGLELAEEDDVPYFAASDIVLVCRKLYAQPMDSQFTLDHSVVDKWYPEEDNWHTLYILEVEKVMIKE